MNLRKLYRFNTTDTLPIYYFPDGTKLRRVGDPNIYKLQIKSPKKIGRRKTWGKLFSEKKIAGVSSDEIVIPNYKVKIMIGRKV